MRPARIFRGQSSFTHVQKVRAKIQREVAEGRGVNVRTVVVQILQIAGEPGERGLRTTNCLTGLPVMKAGHFLIARRVRRRLIMPLKLLIRLRERHYPSVFKKQSKCLHGHVQLKPFRLLHGVCVCACVCASDP